MHVSILTDEDLEILDLAIDAALMEAAERDLELTVADITLRLFEAYLSGERDPERLADAVVFNAGNHWLN